EEIDCSELEITDYREVTVVCKGKPTLEATGADKYSGSRVFWYKNENTEDVLHRGNSFRVDDEITQNRSFWVAEVLSDGEFIPNQGKVSPSGTSTTGSTLNYGLRFDAAQDFTLHSVDVYPDASGDLKIS